MFPRLRRVALLLADPKVAKLPRLAVALAVLYFLWPLDLIPDFLVPIIGWLDDVTLLWAALRWLTRSAPPPEGAEALRSRG